MFVKLTADGDECVSSWMVAPPKKCPDVRNAHACHTQWPSHHIQPIFRSRCCHYLSVSVHVFTPTTMKSTSALVTSSMDAGRGVSVSGIGLDGCTCAAMLWVFLPCWIGLSDRLGDSTTDVHGGRRHRVLQQLQEQQREVPAPIDVIEDYWDLKKFDADSKQRDASRRRNGAAGIRGWRRSPYEKKQFPRRWWRQHQYGCYCGMSSQDASGNTCSNAYIRPLSTVRSSTLDITLAMIKPDAVRHSQDIVELIKEHGFTIVRQRVVRLSPLEVGEFYRHSIRKGFFEDLKMYVSSGPVVAMELARENAVEQWRKLMGDKMDVYRSDNETLRALFGTDTLHTGLHGSDSYFNAECEIRFFFPEVNFDPAIVDDEDVMNMPRATSVEQLANTCRRARYPTMLAYTNE